MNGVLDIFSIEFVRQTGTFQMFEQNNSVKDKSSFGYICVILCENSIRYFTRLKFYYTRYVFIWFILQPPNNTAHNIL